MLLRYILYLSSWFRERSRSQQEVENDAQAPLRQPRYYAFLPRRMSLALAVALGSIIYLKIKFLLYETPNLRVCKIWTWQLDILFITLISKCFQTEIHLGLIKNCQDWPLKKLPQITISSSLVAVGIRTWRCCLFCHFRNNSLWSGAF